MGSMVIAVIGERPDERLRAEYYDWESGRGHMEYHYKYDGGSPLDTGLLGAVLMEDGAWKTAEVFGESFSAMLDQATASGRVISVHKCKI